MTRTTDGIRRSATLTITRRAHCRATDALTQRRHEEARRGPTPTLAKKRRRILLDGVSTRFRSTHKRSQTTDANYRIPTSATITPRRPKMVLAHAVTCDIAIISPTWCLAQNLLRDWGLDMTPENLAFALDVIKEDREHEVAVLAVRAKEHEMLRYGSRTIEMAAACLKDLRQSEEHQNEDFELKQQDVKSKQQRERATRLVANYVLFFRGLAGALCVLAIAVAWSHQFNGTLEDTCPYIDLTKSVSSTGYATDVGYVLGHENNEPEKDEGCIIPILWASFLLALFAMVFYVLPPLWKNLTAATGSGVALIWLLADTTNKIIAFVLGLLTLPTAVLFGWFVTLLYKELHRSTTAEEMKVVVDCFEDRAIVLFLYLSVVFIALAVAFLAHHI